ncbi:MAG TPA: hypothetical protein VF783_13785 [Terriglobales bacterium]
MLELAALAADIDFQPDDEHVFPWNPLEDDGAALRLAVKLKIKFSIAVSFLMAEWGPKHEQNNVVTEEIVESDGDIEILAATRRAIVRAAAEIGAKQ